MIKNLTVDTGVDPLLLLRHLEVGLKYASDGKTFSFNSFLDAWSSLICLIGYTVPGSDPSVKQNKTTDTFKYKRSLNLKLTAAE